MNAKIARGGKPRKIEIGGQEYTFDLNMSSMCVLDDIYPGNPFVDMAEGKMNRPLLALLYAGIKESLPEEMTMQELGRQIGFMGMAKLKSFIFAESEEKLPKAKENDTGE